MERVDFLIIRQDQTPRKKGKMGSGKTKKWVKVFTNNFLGPLVLYEGGAEETAHQSGETLFRKMQKKRGTYDLKKGSTDDLSP